MKMEPTHYLPSEVLKKSNYPELERMQADIEDILANAMIVDQAVLAFNDGSVNRIDVDPTLLSRLIEDCRAVCQVLGSAPNVCYDVLLEIRTLQGSFQDILFASRRFGNEYVGKPTAEEDFGSEGGIG